MTPKPWMRTRVHLAALALLAGCVAPAAPGPGAPGRRPVHCAARPVRADSLLSAPERHLAFLLEHGPGQRRTRLVLDPVLARVARRRAQDMAARNYFSHTDPDGLGANYHVRRAGYRLPRLYDEGRDGNNIESIGAGYPTAAEAWRGWMASPPHRAHLLGLEPAYRNQTEYGVGYAHSPDSGYGHYWVVLIASRRC